jgi:hypothetical protein
MGIQLNTIKTGSSPLVPASTTQVVSDKAMKLTGAGARSLKLTFVTGKVGAAATGRLEHSPIGNGLWSVVRTVAIGTSTDVTISGVNTSTGELTAVGHGLSEGQLVSVSSTGEIPASLSSTSMYYVSVVDASTIKLYSFAPASDGGTLAVPSTAGTGTIELSVVAAHTISIDAGVPADAALLPLFAAARASVVSGAGICNVLRVVLTQAE